MPAEPRHVWPCVKSWGIVTGKQRTGEGMCVCVCVYACMCAHTCRRKGEALSPRQPGEGKMSLSYGQKGRGEVEGHLYVQC